MKILIALALIACFVVVTPVSSGHVIVILGNDCLSGIVVGDVDSLPHACFTIGSCGCQHPSAPLLA